MGGQGVRVGGCGEGPAQGVEGGVGGQAELIEVVLGHGGPQEDGRERHVGGRVVGRQGGCRASWSSFEC